MSLQWIDAKYVSLMAFRLRNFKSRGNGNFNFSCPLCGDSKQNKSKSRGYVFPSKGRLTFHCHNCNVTMGVHKLLKELDGVLYADYLTEILMASGKHPDSETKKFEVRMNQSKLKHNTILEDLEKVSSMDAKNPVKMYVQARKIPPEYHYKLFYCPNFKAWVNKTLPGKFEDELRDEPRLIIPFFGADGELFGFQGRSFSKKSSLRYITIMLDERPKIYGLDKHDPHLATTYVVEGPIDSMFLPNCLAAAGGNIVQNLQTTKTEKERFVVVYDNEPRNPHTIHKMEKAIDQGYRICVWPAGLIGKDINDLILKGYTQKQVVDLIKENTYSGLSATLALTEWKKV